MVITGENVVLALQAKRPEALEYLINQYGQSVYSLARTILRSAASEDVEECVSDIFAAAWQKSKEYDGQKGTIKTWLLMLTKYRALDYRRKLSTQSAYLASDEQLTTSLQAVEDEVLQRERLQLTLAVVETFSELDQKLFFRRYFLQEALDELAAAFDLTKRAVENRLWRCRKELRDQLAEKEGSSCGSS
ncbi:MAG TPA: sigma-70 family RNA polymerase sigma factor [Oscillospiraceae bacterium]|nr:sigma-70 family RNA polymerase sigma factor [Oscillospiraceae bacterium]